MASRLTTADAVVTSDLSLVLIPTSKRPALRAFFVVLFSRGHSTLPSSQPAPIAAEKAIAKFIRGYF